MEPTNMLLEDIALALQTDGMLSYYDRSENIVIVLSESSEDDTEEEEAVLRELIATSPERFQIIDPLPKWKTFSIMESFAASIEDKEVSSRLMGVLKQPRPFATFRRVLNYYPDWLQKWYVFEEAYFMKSARKWLARYGGNAN